MEENAIKVGDYIIIQRQGYTKLHKLKQHGNCSLGQFLIEMDNVIGEKYSDTFQMRNVFGSKKLYTLEKVTTEINSATTLSIESSGQDNRNIKDDGQSQKLTKEEIDRLIDEELSSNNIVGKLINNSSTFSSKTGYSQEKYIKKKEKKYFEYIQIRKPSIRILTQMYYRQDPTKTLGVRIDDLSQILTYSNIQSEGNYLLYDSGTSGLMPAALINAIGSNTPGKLVHLHPGNECQKNAFIAMQYPTEQSERCINVNLYSVLRCFYQNKDSFDEKLNKESKETLETLNEGEPSSKKIKLNEPQNEPKPDSNEEKRPTWQIENEKACQVLKEKVDSLIIVLKEHPVNIVKELLQFLKPGRSIVVFSLLKEPLQDLYVYLKSRLDVISIKLSNNFMRHYQVLPDRTHPEVTMNTGGFILSAYKLNM